MGWYPQSSSISRAKSLDIFPHKNHPAFLGYPNDELEPSNPWFCFRERSPPACHGISQGNVWIWGMMIWMNDCDKKDRDYILDYDMDSTGILWVKGFYLDWMGHILLNLIMPRRIHDGIMGTLWDSTRIRWVSQRPNCRGLWISIKWSPASNIAMESMEHGLFVDDLAIFTDSHFVHCWFKP